MICPNCGKEVFDVNYCPFCGGNVCGNAESPPPVVVAYSNEPKETKKDIQPRKSKKAFAITLAVIAVIIVLGGSFFLLYHFFFSNMGAEEQKIVLSKFECSSPYLVSGTFHEVMFTVQSNTDDVEITLYEGDEKVSQMYDNGQNGDQVANDQVYTCMLELKKVCTENETVTYQCKAHSAKSKSINVYYFPTLTEIAANEARTDYEVLSQKVISIETTLADETGHIPEDRYSELIEAITNELDTAQENGVVLHYEVEGSSIFVKMTSGLSMVYAPKAEDTDSIGNDVSATIITMQPCFTQMGGSNFGASFTGYSLPEDADYILEMLDVSGDHLRNTLPNFRFQNSNNCDDEAVTLEKIRSFGANQVILWHGHGYYGPIVKSCLVTGEPFDWHAWHWDPEYFEDCVSNRIVNSWLLGYEEVIISSKYIQKYCGDMTDSFVYLAACDSGSNPKLAESFTSKGAVVVANKNTIQRTYNVAMLYGTVNEMIKINPATGKFHTLSEALANAKATYGTNDADPRYNGLGATPVIFGGETANNYRFAEDVPTGNISGKVCKALDRTTPISNASIDIYLDGVLFKTETSDESGQYEMDLPIGKCEIKISAAGYISYSYYSDIRAGSTVYMETFLMVEGDETQRGIASGKIINSLSGQGISDVSLTFYKNWNVTNPIGHPVLTAISDESGDYSAELPYGNYTVMIQKEGYTNSSFNIVVQNGKTENQDGTITPEINGNDYLITLTWDENPRDVDAHMEGSLSNGRRFHVYFAQKNQSDQGETICSLDYDDTRSYGPEHITLTANGTAPYYYYLHRYAGDGSLATSGAKVTIEQNNVLIAEFHVPTNLGSADYWNVFAIVDGEIIVNNTITSTPNVHYATED